MNIAMITHWEFPPDVRIELEASALIAEGHTVFVYANAERTRKKVDNYNGIGIRYFTPRTVLGTYVSTSPNLGSMLKDDRVDVIHLQDTPMMIPALLQAKRLGLPFIYDAHEIWPVLAWENPAASLPRKIFLYAYYSLLELVGSRLCQRLVSVVQEQADYFIGRYKVPPAKVAVVMNIADSRSLANIVAARKFAPFQVCYVGGLERARNIETVLETVALLKSIPDMKCVIVGEGSERRGLEEKAKELGISDKLVFTGYQPFNEAMSTVKSSDICLMPHVKSFRIDRTIPHKLSQYLFLGRPVISTPAAPIVRLLSDYVIIWNPTTPQKLAEIILTMYKNPELTRSVSHLDSAISSRYDWSIEKRKLVELYQSLETAR